MNDHFIFLIYLGAFLMFFLLVFFLLAGWKKRKKKTNLIFLTCFSLLTFSALVYILTPAPLLDPDEEVRHLTVYKISGPIQRDITKEIDKEVLAKLLTQAARKRLPQWFDTHRQEDVEYIILGFQETDFFEIYLGSIAVFHDPEGLGGHAIVDGDTLLASLEALIP